MTAPRPRPGYAALASRSSRRAAYIHAAFVAAFVLLALWFKLAAPYDHYFFVSTRAGRIGHLAARCAFALYFFAVLFGAGQWVLRVISPAALFSLAASEEIALSVIAGSALMRMVMLALGFLGLYSFGLIALLGVAALAGAGRFFPLLKPPPFPPQTPGAGRIAQVLLAIILTAVMAVILVDKTLYPSDSGDYFLHYFPYYQHVVEASNIWPSDLWLHFYVSKAAGDIFFAMILSDALASFTVCFVMCATGILITYAFFRRMTGNTLTSLLVAIMTACVFVTPTGFLFWAEFSREHIITGALFWGIVWAGWLLEQLPPSERNAWRNGVCFILAGLLLLRPQMAALTVACFALLAIMAAVRRSSLLSAYVLLIAVSVITAAGMLALNYAVTGVMDVSPFPLFWKFADQERFSHGVSPFFWLLLELYLKTDSIRDINLPASPLWSFILTLRLDQVFPYVLALAPYLILLTLAARRKALARPPVVWNGALYLLMVLSVAAIIFAFSQSASTFRLFVFCTYPVMMIAGIPVALAQSASMHKPALANAATLGTVAIALLALWLAGPWMLNQQRMDFLLGQKTIAEAYGEQDLLWKPGITVCAQVPAGARIWTSQITHQLFETPHCRFETFTNYSMGPDWARIHFENAEVAEALLKRQNLNYFLIDTAYPFYDILPYAPLFRPEEIGKHFGVAWSQDGAYLLTWRSAATSELPPEFFPAYRKSVEMALPLRDFRGYYDTISEYYRRWKRNPHWPVERE